MNDDSADGDAARDDKDGRSRRARARRLRPVGFGCGGSALCSRAGLATRSAPQASRATFRTPYEVMNNTDNDKG